jgi:hypothetical protein
VKQNLERKISSFSEEKEAKRLLFPGQLRIWPAPSMTLTVQACREQWRLRATGVVQPMTGLPRKLWFIQRGGQVRAGGT